MARPAEIPTLDARVAALEEQMETALRPRRRVYRDVWMLIITGVVVFTLANVQGTLHDLKKDGRALCSFREDLQRRADSTQQFLLDHPNGIPGIPASTLRVSLQNTLRTLNALRPLVC